ncbi:MAG: hypothetical protein ACYDCI_00455 [Candidatus Limnocylindrales bacterium]
MAWTHEFRESGNGFPAVGLDVITPDDCGDPQLVRVVAVSPIHTRQWAANKVYLECEPSESPWDDFDEATQDLLYSHAYHVSPLRDDETY